MQATEVRVERTRGGDPRFLGFASVIFDHQFIVHDLRVVLGASGAFVAMPHRLVSDRCPECRAKNHLKARYCNECGVPLGNDRCCSGTPLRQDVAHPISRNCRVEIERAVLSAWQNAPASGAVLIDNSLDARSGPTSGRAA